MGAGVIGLAVAAQLARDGREVLLIESAEAIGTGISSRNSGVIHAGIYYPPGSLKARLCVRGRERLYDFCRSHHVDHHCCGKLIVATAPEQRDVLRRYQERAVANGLHDLEWLEADAVQRLEPAVRADAALHSPSTGIVDSQGLCIALQAEIEQAGGSIALHTPVTALRIGNDHIRVDTPELALEARTCINAAGLAAADLARAAGLDDVPRHFAKGHYYRFSGPSPFHRLVYPVADSAGLGIHVTLDLDGRTRFGPDVEWVDEPDYHFDESRLPRFVDAIRRYYPDLDPDRLEPDSTGIRPKLVPAGAPPADFQVRLQYAGDGRIVHMLGMESPGLTAALAVAEYVEGLIESS
ncbi:MAG: NAD(P)/FAD-dependent oxidoreductase [Halofilum sp. (in: g-proteobacteria)]|nr:NAD(P)/FAD-dependent oxidoreductase [Halofilum sp. (in: g-proteobacteria)]